MIIRINGKECACEKGEYLLKIAKRNGIFIPSLCYHEGLGDLGSLGGLGGQRGPGGIGGIGGQRGIGACRVCIVEVVSGGKSQVVSSCIYPVEREIEVFTASEKIKEQRGVVLTLLARLAPNAKTIQQMANFMGADMPRLQNKEDGDTCILCGRCTTACELIGTGAIAKINRGTTKAIDTPYSAPSSECIGCASCAKVCPTDTIKFEQTETSITIWGKAFEYLPCSACGKPHITQEAFDFLREEHPETEQPLCEDCAKKAVAYQLKDAIKDLSPTRGY